MKKDLHTESAALHGLFWLAAANTAGVVCALLLSMPSLNGLMAPYTFGRLAPLHFNFQLYGWISLPLIGLLLFFFGQTHRKQVKIALTCWSGALALGGVSWLTGHSGGKIFLEWSGLVRVLFPAAMGVLWIVLLAALFRGWNGYALSGRLLRTATLVFLLPVPFVLYLASGPDVYPAVNPHSGGATGSSLLGSTLGIVFLFLLTPLLTGKPRGNRVLTLHFSLFALHCLVFAAAGGGNHSNHEPGQIAALGSLLVWPPVLWFYYQRFNWPKATRLWLLGFAAWGAILCITGWISFLPQVLEKIKFTNALTAHAHLAMAGMVTSFLMLTILALAPRFAHLGEPGTFWVWQTATLLHIVILSVAGVLEFNLGGAFYQGNIQRQILYALRLAAGVAMWLASIRWLVLTLKHRTVWEQA